MPAITRKRKHSGDGDEVQQVQAKKFYAVRKGHRTGVFETWKECQEVTAGFAGAMCRFDFLLGLGGVGDLGFGSEGLECLGRRCFGG
jgi:hypothetical protein